MYRAKKKGGKKHLLQQEEANTCYNRKRHVEEIHVPSVKGKHWNLARHLRYHLPKKPSKKNKTLVPCSPSL